MGAVIAGAIAADRGVNQERMKGQPHMVQVELAEVARGDAALHDGEHHFATRGEHLALVKQGTVREVVGFGQYQARDGARFGRAVSLPPQLYQLAQ